MNFDFLNAPIFATRTAATIAEVREAIQLPSGRWAAHAADAYTRTTGWPATVMTCGVEEALEALSAIATAYGDRIPVFAWLMVEGMYIDDVKRSASALSNALTVIRYKEAFEYSKDRHGAQIVLIDETDLLEFLPRHFQASQPVKLEYPELNADEVKALRICKRPLLTLGWWTFQHNAPDEVLAFASGLGAPIALLPTFHGIRPDLFEDFSREAERTGVLLLPAASIVWTEAFIGADLIYALGGELNEGTLYGLHDFPWVKAKVIEQYKLPFPGIDTGERSRRERWLHRLRKRKADLRQILGETAVKSRSNPRLDPAYTAHAITSAAPENTLFIGEGNGTGMWLWSYLQEQCVLYPDRMATIGLSLAWAFAATLAHRRRPCWILCGDGSLGYQFELFRFLAEKKRNIVVFLFHNGTWDSIRLEQTFLFAQRYPGTDLPDTDYVGMAAQAGWQTQRVTSADELDAILQQARERKADAGPLLVDIRLQPDSIPFAGLSFALAELDYILKPKLLQAAWSLLRLKLRGRMPWRILWMIARLFL